VTAPEKPKAKVQAHPLWGVRTPLPASTARIFSAAALTFVLLVWCILSIDFFGRGALVSALYLPSPVDVLKGLVQLTVDQGLIPSVLTSVRRVSIAFSLCVAVSVPLGVLMGSFETFNRLVDPIISPLRFTPMNAFIPMFIVWFGIEETEKIAFLFFATVVFLLPVVVDAVRSVPEEMVQTAQTLGASKMQVIRTVLVPAALPQIFDNFRVMNGIAWGYILLAEMVNPRTGIGNLFDASWRASHTEHIFALILVVGVIGLLSDLAIRLVNGALFGWRETNG
jgi:NitT/TauT family transport system permease protein